MKTIEAKMEKTMEQKSASTAAPGSPSSPGSSPAPKQVVVNNGFDKLFFAFSIPFIVVSLSLVSLFVILALIPERLGSVPDFVKYVAGDQYEVVVRKLGPMDDNLFRSSEAYVLVRTDADVVSLIEHMNAPNFKFVSFDSPELETDKRWNQVYDSKAEIDKVYRELAGTPPGADCRYFVTWDDPDFSITYLCFSPESKLLLVFRDKKRWSDEEID
ncbi:MAG: hypothetical protein IKS34_00590 [Clostridia bacterium]|nr:hypothetical protein [Clostridia bacterium]